MTEIIRQIKNVCKSLNNSTGAVKMPPIYLMRKQLNKLYTPKPILSQFQKTLHIFCIV